MKSTYFYKFILQFYPSEKRTYFAYILITEAILQGGSVTFFSAPTLGLLALGVGVTGVLAGKTTHSVKVRKLLITVAVLNVIVTLSCLGMAVYSSLAARCIASENCLVDHLRRGVTPTAASLLENFHLRNGPKFTQ